MIRILLAGPTGIGKTVEVLRALGNSALWICTDPGALDVRHNRIVNPAGYSPDSVETLDTDRPCDRVFEILREAMPRVRAGKYAAVVIDTLSTLADRDYDWLARVEKEGHGRVWAMLGSRVRRIVNEVAASGAMFVCICHQKDAFGGQPGGARLPGQMRYDTIPALFSMVLRVGRTYGADGKMLRILRCDPNDAAWTDKDRFGIVVDGEPLDLRSVMRRVAQRARGLQGDPPPRSLLDGSGSTSCTLDLVNRPSDGAQGVPP